MSPRASEPSARVAEILDETRDPAVVELPSTLARGRYAVTRQAVLGVALVVAVAVVMLGGRFLLARQDAVPEPVVAVAADGEREGFAGETGSSAEADGAKRADGTSAAAAPQEPTAPEVTEVTVHVVGQVRSPGVVTLPGGSRVADALERAGGETKGADLAAVNLARQLVDGEQVVVPKPGDPPVAGPPGGAMGAGTSAGAGPGTPPGPGAALVNLNTADLATLETLPGVGPVLAQRIMDWRLEHGQFAAVEELGEVSGIGDKTYERLAPKVTV